MKKAAVLALVIALVTSLSFAQRITESLDNWTLGTNAPEVSSGTRGDRSSGGYIHMLVGTSPMYYEVMVEGEDVVDFWVYDPGNCLENPDPGYGGNGPHWGVQSPLYQYGVVGIGRQSYIAGCLGYSPWSSVSPYSHWWFFDGARGSSDQPFTPGWFRWSINGTWDNMTVTLYDIYYKGDIGGGSVPDWNQGDAAGTIDATTFGGSWEALFGEGWKAFWLIGDNSSGIEDVNIDVTGGSGVFDELGESPIAKPYKEASWGSIKDLYR